MAITFVALSDADGTLTGVEPTGTAQNDVMIATLDAVGVTTAHTGPAGWTQLQQINWNGAVSRASVWWIVRGGSAPALTWAGPTIALCHISIATYRGADTTTPIDISGATANTSSTTPLSPSVTTTTDNGMLLLIILVPATTTTSTHPTGTTSEKETGLGTDARWGLADKTLSTHGATGTSQWAITPTGATFTVSVALALPAPITDPSQPNMVSQMAAQTNW